MGCPGVGAALGEMNALALNTLGSETLGNTPSHGRYTPAAPPHRRCLHTQENPSRPQLPSFCDRSLSLPALQPRFSLAVLPPRKEPKNCDSVCPEGSLFSLTSQHLFAGPNSSVTSQRDISDPPRGGQIPLLSVSHFFLPTGTSRMCNFAST